MMGNQNDRRRFLKGGVALAGLATVGGVRAGQAQSAEKEDYALYGDRSSFVTAKRKRMTGPTSDSYVASPVQEVEGIITPNSLFYISSRDRSPYMPGTEIDPRAHRLMIHGMVDRPLMLSLDDLKRLPQVSRIHFLECVANTIPSPGGRWKWETIQERFGKMSCAQWTGVALSTLLREAGVKGNARWLVAESADGVRHSMSITMEKAMDDAMVAYGMNGEPLRPVNGYPMRMFVPGWEGVRNIKWLRRIKVVDEPYMTQTESHVNPHLRLTGKSRWFNLEMGAKSVITFPAAGGRPLNGPGYYELTGLAWSGLGAIRRVEVSLDDGKTWQDARIDQPALRIAWARFRLPWRWNGDETVIQSRCTDDQGKVQPSLAQFSEIWGVRPDYFQKTSNQVTHFNPIQRWRILKDGTAKNAMWDV